MSPAYSLPGQRFSLNGSHKPNVSSYLLLGQRARDGRKGNLLKSYNDNPFVELWGLYPVERRVGERNGEISTYESRIQDNACLYDKV